MRSDELEGLAPGEIYELRQAWADRERRADLRAGVIAACVANPYRNTSEHPRPFHPADFFPSLEDLRPQPPSDEELDAKIEAAFPGA